ncbi:VPA1262 family N-terminal domain-containing protein [Sporosarcina sp. P2]|uniref:VPA1262 family N-terminal domain-containing protein n=1 Tax=Sporosarcina sp. P2 TaxID=2048251 RepID=UPI00130453F6|nr:VPA1262 family N-terminal domain-containing protein [Sporosarcina sp. P2]
MGYKYSIVKYFKGEEILMNYPFSYFLKDGTIGFYRSAQILNIIIYDRSQGSPVFHNIYTLVTLQERAGTPLNLIRYGTQKPLSIDKQRSLMITYQDVEVDTILELYHSLAKRGVWHQPQSDTPLSLEKLTALSPVFVSRNPIPPIHSGIKNPFRHCQYLFEFYASKKTVFESFSESQQQKITEWVMKHLPIDLQRLTDRWGNIIFQLPVTLLKVEERGSSKSNTKKNIEIAWHPKIGDNVPEISIVTVASYDQTIHGYGESIGTHPLHEIEMGSTEGLISTTVKRNSDNLILYEDTASLMKQLTFNMNIASSKKRKVQVEIGKKGMLKDYYIDLHHVESPTVIGNQLKWKERVAKRQHEESVKKLELEKSFIQYGSNGKKDRDKALSDIRSLIQTYGGNGVYLWDPFCDGNDILNTLYFNNSYGVPLKVITSFSKGRIKMLTDEQGNYSGTFEERRQEIIDQLVTKSNHEGVQLEIRCQYAEHGWKFHDRFLLFPGNPPAVWSLGTSLNSIGSSHSILLKVEHAQPVINAFIDLWDELKEVVIWPPKPDI